jgi:hypothetical protein
VGIGPFEESLAEAFAAIGRQTLKPNRVIIPCVICGQIWVSGDEFPCKHIKKFFAEFTEDKGA